MSAQVVTVRACAKINLTLRVLGSRADGFHEVRTALQSIALHDVLTFARARGPLDIACADRRCPEGRGNIVWKAAARLWRAAGRTGQPRGVRIHIDKRIPMAAGLGGGSADAAATLRALALLWRVRLGADRMAAIAAALGADVPYFLEGGTALGVGRGEVVFPLIDAPARWVVLVVPPVGVATPDAYRWFDEAIPPDARTHTLKASGDDLRHLLAISTPILKRSAHGSRRSRNQVGRPFEGRRPANDLQGPVVKHYPEIGRILRALRRMGAATAAMSGSGSAVFGLFDTSAAAGDAAQALAGTRWRAIVTRTVDRKAYTRLTTPVLARK